MGIDRSELGPVPSRALLYEYLLGGATPRADWRVGMEVERLGRDAASGRPLPYDGGAPSVRDVLERYRARRGGSPVLEGRELVGLDGPWGTISLEPGGQVEWSSRPHRDLGDLARALGEHAQALSAIGSEAGVRWLDTGLDPELPVSAMPWMPKARYHIMRTYLGERGRLAHRMMTQTASVQCAFDYADPADWKRKFRAAALLSPVAVALFANSSRTEGRDSGWQSYRQAIWRETDPDRCGMPDVVFDPSFDLERWLDWVLDVPTLFRHRARGLVPTGGVPFSELLDLQGCDALRPEDWETHVSTIFTEVRSYTYIEVRSADLLPDRLAFAVPALWTGLLYDDGALDAALELAQAFDEPGAWRTAMDVAAREGLAGQTAGRPLAAVAEEMIETSRRGLARDASLGGSTTEALAALEALVEHRALGERS